MINPTVGRVVWYHPGSWDKELHDFTRTHGTTEMAAHVVHVWHGRMVNLVVFDPNGGVHARTSVPLAQEDEDFGEGAAWCQWMPYQKGQAAKTEQLETKLAGGA